MVASKAKQTKSYQVHNWRDYNRSLVNRGNITFWFNEEVIDSWEHDNTQKKNGRPFTYSNTAIETLLTLRELFRLPYRQTEGLAIAIAHLMHLKLRIPSYTNLQKRAAKMKIDSKIASLKGPITIVVDSTGLKVYGEGEWKTRQHGIDKRRTWRKLHLAVDPDSQAIVAQLLTGNDTHDGDAVEPLVNQIQPVVEGFYGDGAYDQQKVYQTLSEQEIWTIIPPRKNAKIQQHRNSNSDPLDRDECLRQIRREGKSAWKESIGYHRRSLAETAMSRLKNSFGDRLKNRKLVNQVTEVAVRCKLLNWFVTLGLPFSTWG